MEVWISYVGTVNKDVSIEWSEGWPVPRVGDEFTVPGLPEVTHVRTVVWYPQGDPDNDVDYPFVYVVVGPRPPA